MTWKQPIPVDIYDDFGDDYLALNLFMHLLMKSCNKDMDAPKKSSGGGFYQLKRGQVIFGRNKFSKMMVCSPSGAQKALKRLEENYKKVTSKVTRAYSVISIAKYDDLVTMKDESNKQSDKRVTSEEQASDTSKSVEECSKSEEEAAANEKIKECFLKRGYKGEDLDPWLKELQLQLPDRDLLANAYGWRDHDFKKPPTNHKTSFRNWVSQEYAAKLPPVPATPQSKEFTPEQLASQKRQREEKEKRIKETRAEEKDKDDIPEVYKF